MPVARWSSSMAPRPPAPIPFRFDELGADLYALPAQKWLLGPEGMGALVVAPSVAERYVPALGGWFSFERVDGAGLGEWWPDARRFESSGLPSTLGGRDGSFDRLAVDVHRTRLRLSARTRDGGGDGRAACGDPRCHRPHAASTGWGRC